MGPPFNMLGRADPVFQPAKVVGMAPGCPLMVLPGNVAPQVIEAPGPALAPVAVEFPADIVLHGDTGLSSLRFSLRKYDQRPAWAAMTISLTREVYRYGVGSFDQLACMRLDHAPSLRFLEGIFKEGEAMVSDRNHAVSFTQFGSILGPVFSIRRLGNKRATAVFNIATSFWLGFEESRFQAMLNVVKA